MMKETKAFETERLLRVMNDYVFCCSLRSVQEMEQFWMMVSGLSGLLRIVIFILEKLDTHNYSLVGSGDALSLAALSFQTYLFSLPPPV